MALNLGPLNVTLKAVTGQFKRDIAGAQNAVGGFGQSATGAGRAADGMSSQIRMAATAFAGLYVAQKVTAVIADSVKTFAEFERTMVRVGAVTQSLGKEEFGFLTKTAQDLAKTTEFTANQVAEAMQFMGMAGFDANKIMASTPAVLQLASAAMVDVGRAADIVTNIMSGYGIEVSELNSANNILVATFTNTNTSLEMLGQSFKYVGPIAKSAGVEFKDAATAIGLMGNAGIQAEMAGTALRGAIGRLLAPTKQQRDVMRQLGLNVVDSNGKIRSLREVIVQLEKSGATTGQIMQLFGQRAGPGMQVLLSQGVHAFDELRAKIDNAGNAAERISKAQLNTLDGQLKILKSQAEGAAIALGGSFKEALLLIIPLLGKAAGLAEDFFNWLSFKDTDAPNAMHEQLTRIDAAIKAIKDKWSGPLFRFDPANADKVARMEKRLAELQEQRRQILLGHRKEIQKNIKVMQDESEDVAELLRREERRNDVIRARRKEMERIAALRNKFESMRIGGLSRSEFEDASGVVGGRGLQEALAAVGYAAAQRVLQLGNRNIDPSAGVGLGVGFVPNAPRMSQGGSFGGTAQALANSGIVDALTNGLANTLSAASSGIGAAMADPIVGALMQYVGAATAAIGNGMQAIGDAIASLMGDKFHGLLDGAVMAGAALLGIGALLAPITVPLLVLTAGLPLLAVGVAALTGGLGYLVTQTNVWADSQATMGVVFEKLVAAMDPFAEAVLLNTGVMEMLFNSLRWLANTFIETAILFGPLFGMTVEQMTAMRMAQMDLNQLDFDATYEKAKADREAAEETAKAAATMREFNEQLKNVPTGFKLRAAQFGATSPETDADFFARQARARLVSSGNVVPSVSKWAAFQGGG